MNRTARIVVGVLVVQAALVGIYLFVEQRRDATQSAAGLSTSAPKRVRTKLRPLSLRTRDGTGLNLQARQRPTLLHIWATWCPPCLTELPGLLELPEKYGIDVVAIALDKEWGDVDRFLRSPSPHVYLGDSGEAERIMGAGALPVTFLLEANGYLSLRFDGARDWTDRSFVREWLPVDQH